MSIKNTRSYTAAGTFPVKILKNKSCADGLQKGIVKPIHVQVSLTNRCNLKCKFCSCKKVNRTVELDYARLERMVVELADLGCQSVTITGGGDPLCYPRVNEAIRLFKDNGISVGLVTNGTMLYKLTQDALDCITWCRVSCSDERELDYKMSDTIEKAPNIDWAFSYVVTADYDPDNLLEYVAFANMHNFTHIRVVSDLLDLCATPPMDEVRKDLAILDDSRVVYQERKQYTRGVENCWISLLKPVIDSEGNIYPCCGVQYADEEESLDFPKAMRMGSIEGLQQIYKTQRVFNGSKCRRCYYEGYNTMIDGLLGKVEHIEFV